MEHFFEQVETQSELLSSTEINHVGEVIKIIGIGGGGCNAVDNMVLSGVKHVEFICANTDYKSLIRNKAHHLVQLGKNITKGLGAGTNPEIGEKAAKEDREKIVSLLKGTDMLFITAGMGGGTGTGAAPVIADIAQSMNILTVGVVTRPFDYEGAKRRKVADVGIEELRKCVDSLIVIPNEKLVTELDEDISMRDAFAAADEVLRNAVAGITEVIKTPGIISLDFADIRTVMSEGGVAMMGSGTAKGQNRAREAVEKAIFSPLLDNISLDGAKGVLVNISANVGSLKTREYHEIIGIINDHIDPNADFKPGMAEVEDMDDDEIRVTVIATGLHDIHANNRNVEEMVNSMNEESDSSSISKDNQHQQSDDSFSGFNQSSVTSAPAFFRRKR
jgi:cell division protein FtsZ